MFRFLAWHSAEDTDAGDHVRHRMRTHLGSTAAQWRPVATAPGFEVWCSGELPPTMIGRALSGCVGAVLGSLFPRTTDPQESVLPITSIDEALSRKISSSSGEALVQECWGNYVAFIRERADQIITVVAPTGTLPCLVVPLEGVTLWCSDVVDLLALEFVPIAISQAYLTNRVIGRFDALQPSLEGIERAHRGECLITGGRGAHKIARRLYWQPLSFAEDATPIEDAVVAAKSMHAVVKHCTHTLANALEPLLLRLSGGLDSSIVAGCLRDVPHPERITCHTYFNPSSAADVRPWARMAAQHAQLRHIECASDPSAMDLRALMNLAPSYDVQPLLPYLGRSTLERELCSQYGAGAVFSGDGGDPGFCSDTVAYALVEYFRNHGLSLPALRLTAHVSLATDRSYWQVLSRSFRRWQFGSSLQDQQSSRLLVSRLVSSDAFRAADSDARYNHPWFAHRDDVPWPTIRRLGALCHPSNFYDLSVAPGEFAPIAVHPLYSQPVVETLLRIPLYVHFEHGRDRGLARRAFAAELPAPIAHRLWKDRAPGFLETLIDRHRSWLREIFLDGLLVRAGLLDRRAVEHALSPTPSRELTNPAEVIRHLDTELWARRWSDVRSARSRTSSLSSARRATV